MIRNLLIIILLIKVGDLYSQNLFGDFSYSEGYKYNIAEELKLNSDSTYNYEWFGDLSSRFSFGIYSVKTDTLYLESQYKSYIKSVYTDSVNENCIFISVLNQVDLNFADLSAKFYFSNSSSVTVEIKFDDIAVVGQICEPMNSKEKKLLEFKLKEIDKIKKLYYSHSEIDSIVISDFEGKLGTIKSSIINGNNIVIELLDRNYSIFNGKKCLIKNSRKIYWIYDDQRARLLRKK